MIKVLEVAILAPLFSESVLGLHGTEIDVTNSRAGHTLKRFDLPVDSRILFQLAATKPHLRRFESLRRSTSGTSVSSYEPDLLCRTRLCVALSSFSQA